LKNHRQKQKNGVTLVELLVVTTIIVIKSAVIYPSYRDIRG